MCGEPHSSASKPIQERRPIDGRLQRNCRPRVYQTSTDHSPGIVDGHAQSHLTHLERERKEKGGSAQCSLERDESESETKRICSGTHLPSRNWIQREGWDGADGDPEPIPVFSTPATEPRWHVQEEAIRFSQRRRFLQPRRIENFLKLTSNSHIRTEKKTKKH